jgi:hypothetical protein
MAHQGCPHCPQEANVRFHLLGNTKTLGYFPPFFDSDRKQHQHDESIVTNMYQCSNGHRWPEKVVNKCPACAWPSEQEEKAILKGTQNDPKPVHFQKGKP